jgi:polysaccharide pyruvyl transferase WcaK-like protein
LRRYLGNPSYEEFLHLNKTILESLLGSIPEASIVLLAHDNRVYESVGHQSDQLLVTDLYTAIHSSHGSRVFCYNLPRSASEVAMVCDSLDFAISGRMHFAIACLRSGKPVVCIEFQDKVTGLMKDIFKLPELTIPVSDLSRAQDFATRVTTVYSQRSRIQKTIQVQLPLARANCHSPFEIFVKASTSRGVVSN